MPGNICSKEVNKNKEGKDGNLEEKEKIWWSTYKDHHVTSSSGKWDSILLNQNPQKVKDIFFGIFCLVDRRKHNLPIFQKLLMEIWLLNLIWVIAKWKWQSKPESESENKNCPKKLLMETFDLDTCRETRLVLSGTLSTSCACANPNTLMRLICKKQESGLLSTFSFLYALCQTKYTTHNTHTHKTAKCYFTYQP